ncbi:hypothetical protein CFP56_001056 [Quercus suber]|uniref:Bacterial Ig-like domain-containing protein n=2 Tax=Quercus suber TaxID=58331 RepID=A0AAW0IN45_QUESU
MSQTSIMVCSKMGLLKLPLVVLLCSVFSLLSFIALCDASELTVKFLKTPHAFSNLNSTTFVFEVLVGGSGACTNFNITCKLDDGFGRINASQCENGTVLCEGLQDGNHKFEVCPNGTQGVGCSSYNWIVDTIPPTAYVSASTPFTNALNVSINISFSEPCTGGGGFVCASVNACNLLVYGAGQVIPTSLKMLQPNLQYSVLVGLSSIAQYGRVTLVMDNNFCTDSAGNKFTRNANSTLYLHLNRRSVNLTTHVPKRQLQFNGETIQVRATNNYKKLRVCLTFPEPVLNTSEEIKNSLKAEILYSLQMSEGSLLPLVDTKQYQGPSRFEYKVAACTSDTAIVYVSVDTNSIISRQGTPVSPTEPFTFIYDSLRPAVMLSTPSHNWTRERNISVWIKFGKPVFGFNCSHISITGGKLQRQVISGYLRVLDGNNISISMSFYSLTNFHFCPFPMIIINIFSFEEVHNGKYTVVIKADKDIVSVYVPENVTRDAAGNKNQPSNVLQVMHHSVPKIPQAIYGSITGSFVVIVIAAGLLTVSIANLHSNGEFSSPSPSQSESNLFRIACHLQVIALSGWLAVSLPEEYYELTRGLRWSIPYLSLPWEREPGRTCLVMENSSLPVNVQTSRPDIKNLVALVGKDYKSAAETEHLKSVLDPRILDGWKDFGRNMFWLAIIGGGLIIVHALLILILKLKKKNSKEQRDYGGLISPRFEIIIVNLALTSICEASAAIIGGGMASGIAVGVLLLGVVSFLLLAWLFFLYKGITRKQLLEYEEDHQKGRGFRWYKKIFLVSVEGAWRPSEPTKEYVSILGSLYEDYRGPPRSKLSQISGGSSHTQAEAPFIQKLFGILRINYILLESVIQKLCGELRIYYPLLESGRRVLLAIMAGFYKDKSSSKIPTTFNLCINCFHLFFLVLEKPFIKKNIQLLEITAVSSEACISAILFVLGEKRLSDKEKNKIGILMLILVLVGILPQIMNELYALYKQTKQLDLEKHLLLTGLKRASSGLTLLFSSKEFSLSKPPALKDNIADSNSKPTSFADEDTATSTSTSYQVKSPNQD